MADEVMAEVEQQTATRGPAPGGVAPWVEKYRPATIDELQQQDQVVSTLKNAIKTGNLPHMLFYGPPGTGKTSAILALAKDLFGPQMYRSRVLELNASDERGIDVVRHKIKHFASLAVSANKSATHSCPPFKLIILDEADCMTVDAQSALRRTMETYTKVTRFCILCNYVSRIIGPIASRCAKFRFQPMSKDVMTSRLSFISDKEGFTLPPDAAAALLRVSGGDLRRAITLLQNTYMLHGAEMSGKHITDSAAVIPDSVMLELVAACRSNSFDKMQAKINDLIADGYPANQIVLQLHDWVMSKENQAMSQTSKALICRQLAATDKCLVDGADETLQLLHLSSVTLTALQA